MLENPDLLSPEERNKLIEDLIANMGDLDSETQKKLLKQLLENPDLLPPGEKEKLIQHLMSNLSNLDK